jgi:hypothetical protein
VKAFGYTRRLSIAGGADFSSSAYDAAKGANYFEPGALFDDPRVGLSQQPFCRGR